MDSRPNIVLIMADQMAADVIGALGHPAVRTPNIDRLVETGVTFGSAYCNSPLCVPARSAFMAGRLASGLDVFDNGSEFRASVPTFVHHLRRSGYETILAGKMHFIGPDQLHGFEHRLTKDIHIAGFELTPDWNRGAYANTGTGVKRLKNPGLCDWNNQLGHDEKVLYRTVEKIRALGRSPERKPFFLCASFIQPHDPFVTTKEYWDLYKDADVPMPAAPAQPFDAMHPYNQWIQVHHEVDVAPLTEKETADNRRAYYGMVTYIDDKVGQIVRELERMKLLDNTIILFTSDHGEMLGDHGMWFKRTFYEQAVKVPLVVSWPGGLPAGRTVDRVVSLMDIGPTLMKLAGVPDADDWIARMEGRSFDRLLVGDDAEWADEAICEYCGEGTLKPMVSIRMGRYKYVYVHEHEPLLFDLQLDPLELTNMAGHPESAAVRSQFEAELARRFDFDELESRVRQSQEERLMMLSALQAGERTKWDHVPPA